LKSSYPVKLAHNRHTKIKGILRDAFELLKLKRMSSHKQVVIKLTEDQRSEIREKLEKEVSHIRMWIVPGTVVLAEAISLPESPDVR
jgi:hypothetical protein